MEPGGKPLGKRLGPASELGGSRRPSWERRNIGMGSLRGFSSPPTKRASSLDQKSILPGPKEHPPRTKRASSSDQNSIIPGRKEHPPTKRASPKHSSIPHPAGEASSEPPLGRPRRRPRLQGGSSSGLRRGEERLGSAPAARGCSPEPGSAAAGTGGWTRASSGPAAHGGPGGIAELLPRSGCLPAGMESLGGSLKKKAAELHYRAEVMIAGEQLSTGQLRVLEDRLVLLGGRGFLAPLASCTKPRACCGATGTLGTPASDGDTGTLGTLAAWHSPAHGAWTFGVMREGIPLRLHDGKLIKDRRYHLRTYPNCFVAKELTDWLIDHKEAPDRETGIRLMQKLMDHYIIHHVCDEHSDYKDAKLLYRFRKDDGTFPLNKDVKVFVRGQSLYEKCVSPSPSRGSRRGLRSLLLLLCQRCFWLERFARCSHPCLSRLRAVTGPRGVTAPCPTSARLVGAEGSILKVREENSVKYQRTFLGCEMVDWLVQEGEAESRKEAVELGQALLEHGIIQHVSNRHHFFDGDLLYQFWINFRRRRRLTELLNENSSRTLSESPDSPFCLRKLNSDPGNTSFLSVQPNKEIKIISAVRRSSITSLAGNSNPYFSITPTLVFPPVAECNPKSVLKRPVTNEELLSPGAPYVKKTLTIVGDAVGWGFVVRGGRPCHIQAVDPGGPAAAAGMKVCQFVFSVNGMYVLHLDYQTISSLIMTGPRTLVMEVMEAVE
ncbi:DEP domain-containing mTOR-interacting protein-like isoform X1 [Aix galericulata]|nr:DEP domain-containing mTOR-interacting protein-like isoform X1 [Aix galericulata]